MNTYTLAKDIASEILEGGAGSGNWGHKGRPGHRGGSLGGGGKGGGGKGGGISAHKVRGGGGTKGIADRNTLEKMIAAVRRSPTYRSLMAKGEKVDQSHIDKMSEKAFIAGGLGKKANMHDVDKALRIAGVRDNRRIGG